MVHSLFLQNRYAGKVCNVAVFNETYRKSLRLFLINSCLRLNFEIQQFVYDDVHFMVLVIK